MNLISGHLTRLFDVSGRENRQPFWLWILVVYGVQTVLTMMAMVPVMVGLESRLAPLQQYDQSYLDAHPEVATQLMMNTIMPVFRTFFVISGVTMLLMILLLAAAMVRRLHDTNRSGFWGLPLAILQIGTLLGFAIIFPRFFAAIGTIGPGHSPDAANAAFGAVMPIFLGVWLLNFTGFIYTVILIVFLAQRGTIGPNRYGPDLLPLPAFYGYPPPSQPVADPGPWADRRD